VNTGQVAIWTMNGITPTAETMIQTVSPEWHALGTGDYNGDGKSDIIWQNVNTGQTAIWLMNGTTPTAETVFATPPPNWHVIAS
jgi:hypothetical protein